MTYNQVLNPADDYPSPVVTAMPQRRGYSVFAISSSFLTLWLAPVFGGDAMMGYAMLGCLVICLWDAPACLFLLIASVGAYFSSPEAGAFKITPTQIVAIGLMVRCMVSPGLSGIWFFLQSVNGWVKGMLLLFLVGIFGTAVMQLYVPAAIQVVTAVIVFLVVGSLAVQIRDLRWIVIPLTAGLLLAAAYYVLIWAHLLGSISEGYISRAGGELRVSAGRSDPNYVCTLVSPCFAVLLLVFLTAKGLFRRGIVFAGAGVCFLATMDTGSRAGLGVLVLGSMFAVWFAFKARGVKAIYGALLLAIFGAVFAVASWGMFQGKMLQTIERIQEASTRSEWTPAVAHVFTHVLPNPRAYQQVSEAEAHQTYLTAGIEGGLLSLVGLAGATIACIAVSWRQVKLLPARERIWQQGILLILMLTAAGLCFISDLASKVLWGMFAISGLPMHALGAEEPQELPVDENLQGPA